MYELLRSMIILIPAFACFRTANERGAKEALAHPCTEVPGCR